MAVGKKEPAGPRGFVFIVILSVIHSLGSLACADAAAWLTPEMQACGMWRMTSRLSLAVFMVSAASMRFNKKLVKNLLEPIVPPPLPAQLCVMLSGILEGLGGILLLLPSMEYWGGMLILAVLLAVFPANVYHAVSPTAQRLTRIGPPAVYFRLPIQVLFAYWARWHILY